MAHGSEGSEAVPNLIPLLDVVFQLLMFFMICVNFVTEQVNAAIKLPTAQSARPMAKSETDVLYLNLNGKGLLEVPGEEFPLPQTQWRLYLKNQFEDRKGFARERTGKDEVKTKVVIRADKDNEYKQVYNLMQLCRQVGFRKLQLRAMTE